MASLTASASTGECTGRSAGSGSEEFPIAHNADIAAKVLAAARVAPVDDDEKKPLWRYVRILEKTGKGEGANAKIKCRLCDHQFQGRYYRVKAHLLKISGAGVKFCRVVTVHVLEQLRA